MARPIWKGAISFGLVSIPVSVHPGEARRELALHMLDGRDMARVRNKHVNERTGEEVPNEEIVKGYEYEPDRHVVLSEEDFRRADVEATQTIDIVGFVRSEDIDPAYFDRPYYLTPPKSAAKGYMLLREALARTGYVGVAKIVIRTRQHLAALMPRGRMLVLELMRWPYELRDPEDLDLPGEGLGDVDSSKKELAMAEQLVEAMVEAWDPSRYEDTYHDDLMRLIRERVEAGELAAPGEAEVTMPAGSGTGAEAGAEVVDIMALLKRSVESAGGEAARSGGSSKGPREAAG